jgi:hypothetical protein
MELIGDGTGAYEITHQEACFNPEHLSIELARRHYSRRLCQLMARTAGREDAAGEDTGRCGVVVTNRFAYMQRRSHMR